MELYRVLVCVCGVFVGDTNVLFTDGMLACYKFDDWLRIASEYTTCSRLIMQENYRLFGSIVILELKG